MDGVISSTRGAYDRKSESQDLNLGSSAPKADGMPNFPTLGRVSYRTDPVGPLQPT